MTGVPLAKVIHNFGRASKVDKEAFARLVSSISRVPGDTRANSVTSSDPQIIDSRRLDGAFVLDQIWECFGIAAALRGVAKGHCLDGDVVKRICFALVAQRCLEPAAKLAAVTLDRLKPPDGMTCFLESVLLSMIVSVKCSVRGLMVTVLMSSYVIYKAI